MTTETDDPADARVDPHTDARVDPHTDARVAARRAPGSDIAGRKLGVGLLVAGGLGLLAAIVLLVEKIALLKDADYVPSCSINPILSCGSVMGTWQAETFGVPNPVLGVAGFAALTTLGALLASGSDVHRRLWWLVQAAATFGVLFVHWLVYQSLYVIGALCPYCMVVWVVTIAAFVVVTARTLSERRGGLGRIGRVLGAYWPSVLTAWLLVILLLITQRFWSYWITLV